MLIETLLSIIPVILVIESAIIIQHVGDNSNSIINSDAVLKVIIGNEIDKCYL